MLDAGFARLHPISHRMSTPGGDFVGFPQGRAASAEEALFHVGHKTGETLARRRLGAQGVEDRTGSEGNAQGG
jgi:hypothetical protein